MSDYIVLENIPNTPEGRAFLKQLRKYLRPQYKMRSRGRHSNRKEVAKRVAAEFAAKGDTTHHADPAWQHYTMRQGLSCKHAERITTVVEVRNDKGVQWFNGSKNRKRGYYVIEWKNGMRVPAIGPFRTWEAALTCNKVDKGVGK